jgi:hypothetical protein
MSRDDFDLDDGFDFDDEDSFDFDEGGEEIEEDGGDFDFDEEEGDFDLDDVDEYDETDDDFFDDEEDELSPGGPSRVFIMLAGAMIFVFILGLLLVMVMMLSDGGTEGIGPVAERETENAGIIATATEDAIIRDLTHVAELTKEAEALAASQTAEALQAEQDAADTATAEFNAEQTALALQATPTPLPPVATEPPEVTEEPVVTEEPPTPTRDIGGLSGPAQTATAIAGILYGTPQDGNPTVDPNGVGGTAVPTVAPTALAQTGLFDGLSGGGSGFALVLIMAFGLIGVIFGSRSLRSANNRAA